MTATLDQLERVTALLALGLSVAMQRGAVTDREADTLLFSPDIMWLLKRYGARKSVVDLIHRGTEIGSIERLAPEELGTTHEMLQDAAIAVVRVPGGFDYTSPRWLHSLDLGGSVVVPLDVDTLVENLNAEDVSLAVTSALELGTRRAADAATKLRETLMTTSEFRLRDACAIALSELRDEKCVSIIESLLKDPSTEGRRVFLLLALEGFDNRALFPLLVSFVVGQNDAEREAAFDLLAAMDAGVDLVALESAKRAVREALRDAEGERMDQLVLLSEIVEGFEICNSPPANDC